MFTYSLKLALQSLRHHRSLTLLMVITIAIGIAACMTTLTVYRLLAADPLPHKSSRIFYPQLDTNAASGGPPRTPADMLDYRSAMDLWGAKRAARQAIVNTSEVKLQAEGSRPLMQSMLATTADFFAMFEVPMRYGQAWSAQDDEHRSRVAVISAALNRQLFGGENSVGRQLLVRGQAVRIIGVLDEWRPSPRFYNIAGGNFAEGQTAAFYDKPEGLFMPFSTALEVNDGYFRQFTCFDGMPQKPGRLTDTTCVWLQLWVEADNPAQADAYRQFLAHYAAEQQRAGRIGQADNTRMLNLRQWLDFNQAIPRDVSLQLWLSLGFLLLCLVNTIGLLLAKFSRRRGEFGVRRALGASRRYILQQCLLESGVIGCIGGILGFALVLVGLWRIRQQASAYADLVYLDWPMFALLFALAITVSVLAGLIPALRASQVAPSIQLKVQ
ncbi:ABC transporter ATP-binding protein [Lysobacteraceae bacterium NML07-0707]|nr:ABC transporter ATP-binding protein [Xanthomonadaceae bacterium NML07-0707]